MKIYARDLETGAIHRVVVYSDYEDRVTLFNPRCGHTSQIKELVEILPQEDAPNF